MDRRQSECRSVGDPHIITFDGRSVLNFLTHIILLGGVLTNNNNNILYTAYDEMPL